MLLTAFRKIASTFAPPHPSQSQQAAPTAGLKSRLLVGVVEALPRLRDPIKEICDAVDFTAAEQGKEEAMWTDVDRFPVIDSLIMASCTPATPSDVDAEPGSC